MSLEKELTNCDSVFIHQRKELAELFGFETRNKYSIDTQEGMQIGFAAEQQKGFAGILLRQFLGHWRTFDIHLFGANRQEEFCAKHPFRWYFQRLELYRATGEFIGALEKRFSLLSKKFELHDRSGNVLMEVSSPIWRIWSFSFEKNGNEVALITKKWGGILREGFTDADKFLLQFTSPTLSTEERLLLVAAGLFIDLQYFENNQRGQNVPFDLADMISPG